MADNKEHKDNMEIEEDEATKQQRIEKENTAALIAGTKRPSSTAQSTHIMYNPDLKRNFSLLERAVDTAESRFTTRVLRTLPSIRRRLTAPILAQVITETYGPCKFILIVLTKRREAHVVSSRWTKDRDPEILGPGTLKQVRKG